MYKRTISLDSETPTLVADLSLVNRQSSLFDSIPDALAALRSGEAIVVVDDEARENEGDLICAAEFATPAMINFMATHARGLICLAMTGDRLDHLQLPPMVASNTDHHQTAFTVSIDANTTLSVTTGISAVDRSRTIQAAIDPITQPQDLRRPGHIFPLRSQPGGVLQRAGHTEAAIDLTRLAGLYPAGVICEIQNPNGSMARLRELRTYAHTHKLKIISIADLIRYRIQVDRFMRRETVANLPTEFGNFQIYGYRNSLDNSEAVAIVKGNLDLFAHQPVVVRIHAECLLGDAMGSLLCDCHQQLQTSLRFLEASGLGVLVYLRQPRHNLGLGCKPKPPQTSEPEAATTYNPHAQQGSQFDLPTYGVGIQILQDLGIEDPEVFFPRVFSSNNPNTIQDKRP
jgi:3,4-dihydroxy 2-butanone 4-phosphate synthase/GTP cyclohydrolase II